MGITLAGAEQIIAMLWLRVLSSRLMEVLDTCRISTMIPAWKEDHQTAEKTHERQSHNGG